MAPHRQDSPATQARQATGMSITEAARAAQISEGYLRRMERQQGVPFLLARRLARLYGCPVETFLPVKHREEGNRTN